MPSINLSRENNSTLNQGKEGKKGCQY